MFSPIFQAKNGIQSIDFLVIYHHLSGEFQMDSTIAKLSILLGNLLDPSRYFGIIILQFVPVHRAGQSHQFTYPALAYITQCAGN